MILDAESPAQWLDRHFAAYHQSHQGDRESFGPNDSRHRLLRYDELLGGDGFIAATFARWREEGIPAAAAGMYLSGWFGGLAAAWLSFSLIASDAAFLPDRRRIAWWLHPEFWTDGTVLGEGTRAVVLPGHPWAGRPDTDVVPDRDAQRGALVAALIETVTPLVEQIQEVSRAGRTGLWHEVSDGFASAVVYQHAFRLEPEHLDDVRALMATPGAPWKRKARVEYVQTDFAPYCAMQKGGCCLAYTEPEHLDDEHEHDEDEDHREFHALFPEPEDAPGYCSNCKFRQFESCRDIQGWWRRREHDRRTGAYPPVAS